MTYTRQRNFIAISFIIFLIIVAHYIGWLIPVENFLRSIINSGSSIAYNQSIALNEEKFENVEDLKNAYLKNKEKLIGKEILESKLLILEEDNKKFQDELNFLKEKQYKHLGAEVIGKNVDPLANTIIINRGSSDNIEIGNPVIAFNGVFVGKIIRAEKGTSIIRLLQDSQSKVAAALLNTDRSIGLVEGGFGISMQMNFIPENEKVSIDDKIVTSGLEENIPRGLLIGKVESVKKEAYEPFQQAIVTPTINLNSLSSVVVIVKNG